MTARKVLVAVDLVVAWLSGSLELLARMFSPLLEVQVYSEAAAHGVVVAVVSATS